MRSQPVDTSRSASRARRLSGTAVALLLAVTAAVGCGGDDASDGAVSTNGGAAPTTDAALSTGPALQAIQELTGRVAPPVGESIEIDVCPMGGIEALVAQGPAAVQEVAIGVPTTYQYVFQSELAGEHPFITCMLESPDGVSNVGLSVGQVVPDFKEDTIRVLSKFDLAFEQEYAYLGGTMLQYCAVPLEEDAPFCEVDWFDGNVWVGVFITADDRSVAVVDEWLRAVLPGVLESTVVAAPTATAI